MSLLELYLFFCLSIPIFEYTLDTDSRLKQPFKTFNNSYLILRIFNPSLEEKKIEDKFHYIEFVIHYNRDFRISPMTKHYKLDFTIDFKNKYGAEELPSKVKKLPSIYFFDNCDYIIQMPTGFPFAFKTYTDNFFGESGISDG